MAKKAGLGAQFYIAGYDLSGDVGAIDTIQGPRGVFDVTGINKSAMERVYGRNDAEISFTSFFNDAAGQEHAALKGLPTADVLVLAMMAAALGSAGAMLTAKQINYDPSRSADGSLAISVQCLANGVALEWGKSIIAASTIAAAGNSAVEDNAASSASGMAAMIQCWAFTGTSITVAVQESSDNGGVDPFAASITFTAISAANKAERKTVAGTVERYLRLNYSGTFTEAKLIVATRRGTAQDTKAY